MIFSLLNSLPVDAENLAPTRDITHNISNQKVAARTVIPAITFTYAKQTSKTITVAEKQGLIQLTATLSEAQTNDVSFSFNQFGGTAENFKDFSFTTEVTGDITGQATGATITFSAGETAQDFFIVNILDDQLDEPDETITFFFSNARGAKLSQTELLLTISDDETTPILFLFAPGLTRSSDGSYSAAIDEGEGGVSLSIKLLNEFNKSSYDLPVKYTISQNEGVSGDYEDPGKNSPPALLEGTIVLPAEQQEKEFQLPIVDDTTLENQETIKFTLTATENAIIHATHNNIIVTINDNDANSGAINNTGVKNCYNAIKEIVDCDSSAGFPSLDQDGSQYSQNNFEKLNDQGQILSSTASNATCIYDKNTQLVWQIKKDRYSFSWFNKILSVNGGDEGFVGPESTSSASPCSNITPCNTDHYADVLNGTSEATNGAKGLCNISNWRLPKLRELMSIMDFGASNELVLIDDNFFNVASNRFDTGTIAGFYWTATPIAVSSKQAWCIYFGKLRNNHIRQCDKTESLLVRMVATCNPSNPNRPC